ncbi:MAG: HAMP domain-containing histidine kinase, partial [Cyclobacteriaceae bacterium]|nr:HAMP domain-containing histidine kinase [Cyclobacteriaceae bacterium]
IGDLLGEDSIYTSKVTILFHVILLGVILTLSIGIIGFLMNSTEVGFRALVADIIMISLLYVMKWKKSITLVAHVLVITMLLTILSNIYIIFQTVDYSTLSIFFVSGIFSFLFLKLRWAIIYSSIQLAGILNVLIFELIGVKWISLEAAPLNSFEQAIAYIVIMILILYIIWNLHFANESIAITLSLQNKKLEDVNKMLNKSKHKAEEMNRLKTNFLANMSHEVRAPINGIIGLSEIIEIDLKDKELLKLVALQKESSRKLLNTITGILELSRKETEDEEIVLEEVDVIKLLQDSFTLLQPIAIKKNIEYKLITDDVPLICLATNSILYQIFNNIIGNAIKFTNNGTITVTIFKENNYAITTVTDTGVGISPEFLPHIFNSFEREVQKEGTHYEGTGLGLTISQKYINLIGGEINVSSEKGKGTEFSINIPLVIS